MLELIVDDGARGRLSSIQLGRLARRVGRMVRAAGMTEGSPTELEMSLRLCDDATIHALNRDFRNKNRPTDVLAFAMREGPMGALLPQILGDVIISVDTAQRQARRGLYREILFLASHGLCHLLGYDHQTDAEEAEMNARMRALRREAERKGPTRPA